MTDFLITVQERKPLAPAPESPLKIGVYMSSDDIPMFTSLGIYHPNYAPVDCDLGPADKTETWFDAYHMLSDLDQAVEEADQQAEDTRKREYDSAREDGDDELAEDIQEADILDYRPGLHIAGVSAEGDLYIAADNLDDLRARAGDDLTAMFAAAEIYDHFTRDEVYDSHGVTPRFAEIPTI